MGPLHRSFKALADPNRLRILNVLLNGRYCVCELESILKLPQSLISRHLAYLRGAGLVEDRRQGMRVQYGASLQGTVGTGLRAFLQEALHEEVYQTDNNRRITNHLRTQPVDANALLLRRKDNGHENQGLVV